MSKHCDDIYAKLIDIVYGESELDNNTLQHLDNCACCSKQYDDLASLKSAMDLPSCDYPIESNIIEDTLCKFEQYRILKRRRRSTALFLGFAGCYMALGLSVAYLYSPQTFFAIQGLLYLSAFFSIIPILRLLKARGV